MMDDLLPDSPRATKPATIQDMIAEVNRELRQRGRAYPRFVAEGKLGKAQAERQTERLEAVLKLLTDLDASGYDVPSR